MTNDHLGSSPTSRAGRRAACWTSPECPDCAPGGPLGRDGYQDRIDRSDETAPFPSEQCDTAIELSSGYARIVLFNNKFEVDACRAATALLSTVADRVG